MKTGDLRQSILLLYFAYFHCTEYALADSCSQTENMYFKRSKFLLSICNSQSQLSFCPVPSLDLFYGNVGEPCVTFIVTYDVLQVGT